MSFERSAATTWHREIPGARWFKADLHIHTIDDHPGRRARMPHGVSGRPTDTTVLRREYGFRGAPCNGLTS